MKAKFVNFTMLVILLICQFSVCPANEIPDPNSSTKYLNAVRTFADNVLKYGRDTYGPKHTPLFVDGLNIHTHEPVKWISPKGNVFTATDTEEWILSNFASQQTLLRTLDGLSSVTGDAKYREVAMQVIQYAFEHLRTPNGLFYWGHLAAYDAKADKPYRIYHVLKLDYPHYELMWKVDPNETKRSIEAYWSAHVNDWSNLDFNRIAQFGQRLEEPWNHEYDEDSPTFFRSKHGGGGFFTTGTSLVHAGSTLYRLSGHEQPLVWSKRLMKRFIDTRHPSTGIVTGLYNDPNPKPPLGDDLKEHFVDPRATIFPGRSYVFEKLRCMYFPEIVKAHWWISVFLVGEMLGEDGRQFTQWALEELTAWGKASYRKKDNSFVPIITDGTNIEGCVNKDNSVVPKGAIAKPLFADLTFFWGYAVGYRVTGDEYMWKMVRDIALGNNFGDIGETATHTPRLQTNTTCSDVYGLLGFLEIYRRTKSLEFLKMAQCIGDNIVDNQFHKGFFVPSKRHIYTRFDCFEPLALLHLHAAIKSKTAFVPQVWPSSPLFIAYYRYRQEGVDRRIIYTLTESTDPPLSLQEAAAIGDVELVHSLLDNGVGVDSWDDSYYHTALQRAAMSDHKDIVELLLARGARIDARGGWPSGTALDVALRENHQDIVKLLVAKGAEVSIYGAAFIGDVDKVKGFLERGGSVGTADATGQTLLHYATAGNWKDIAELLIANGANVNAVAGKWKTPLGVAARTGSTDVAECLIANGADVNAGEGYWTPLQEAAYYGKKEMVELLLAKGADFNNVGEGSWTPLHGALYAGNFDIVKLLLAKGADVNVSNDKGWTPLHYAVDWYGNLDIVKLLLSKGADVNAKDNNGKTALSYAIKHGYTEIVELLRKHGAREEEVRKEGEVRKEEESPATPPADINKKTYHYRMPLHKAAAEA
ncbi:MAG: ankyrin repeat domain-containing protein, partial [Deltaproteobacteria bacterium]|nr:ankyrin repeat domain-containing protein [Deltaproteobacteria bacterium]